MNNKIYDFRINENVVSGILNGLYYRIAFEHPPTPKEARKAIKEAANANNKEIKY